MCYAGAAIFGRAFTELAPIVPAAGSMLCGAAILIPLSLLIDRPWTLAPPRLARCLAALGVLHRARLPHLLPPARTLGSVGTTAQAYLRVPIGVAIGVVFLGESLSPTVWAGLVCVVVGVAAMTVPSRKRA